MMRQPPRSTLLPCTTLFRSVARLEGRPGDGGHDVAAPADVDAHVEPLRAREDNELGFGHEPSFIVEGPACEGAAPVRDRKSTRLNSSHANISYAVFCLKKKR